MVIVYCVVFVMNIFTLDTCFLCCAFIGQYFLVFLVFFCFGCCVLEHLFAYILCTLIDCCEYIQDLLNRGKLIVV